MAHALIRVLVMSVLVATAAAPSLAAEPTTLKSTDDMVAKTVDFGPRDKMPGAELYSA